MSKQVMTESIEYYTEKYKNKTSVPQVVYDAMGDAVTIQPGKTKNITRGRRIFPVAGSKKAKRGSGRKRSTR